MPSCNLSCFLYCVAFDDKKCSYFAILISSFLLSSTIYRHFNRCRKRQNIFLAACHIFSPIVRISIKKQESFCIRQSSSSSRNNILFTLIYLGTQKRRHLISCFVRIFSSKYLLGLPLWLDSFIDKFSLLRNTLTYFWKYSCLRLYILLNVIKV